MRATALLLAWLAATPAAAAAQLATASASFLGTSGNQTATARGFGAIGVNPAGLGMPGPRFSMAVAPFQLTSGLDPITMADLSRHEGQLLSPAVKEDWLAKVAGAGGQSGAAGVEVSAIALSVGPFGFQLSTLASTSLNLAPDIVEVALYGNAGRTGQATDLALTGSSARAFAVTTGGLSFGRAVEALAPAGGQATVGATLKYSVGHFVAFAEERGGSLTSDPISVRIDFPVLHTDDERLGDGTMNNGSGVGLDVGYMWTRDRVSFGASVRNLLNTFSWDAGALVYRPGTATFDDDNDDSDFDPRPGSAAPAALRAAVDDMKFNPTLALGAAYEIRNDLTLSGDVRSRFGDGLDAGPKFHLGGGAEYRGLRVLHLRGGAAVVSGGVQVAGGASLVLGSVASISGAGALRTGSGEDASVAQLTVSFGGR